VYQDVRIYAGLFNGEERAKLELAQGRIAYVHVVPGSVSFNSIEPGAGDAAKLAIERSVDITGGTNAEVLVFDLSRIA